MVLFNNQSQGLKLLSAWNTELWYQTVHVVLAINQRQALYQLSYIHSYTYQKYEGYYCLFASVYLKWTKIHKWRAHLWESSASFEVCDSTSNLDLCSRKIHIFDLDLEARRHTFNVGDTFCWKSIKEGGSFCSLPACSCTFPA